MDPVEEAFRRAQHGDFVGIDAHLAEPGGESPWQLALRAIYAMTLPGRRDALPDVAEIEAYGDHPGAVEARRQHDLASLLALRSPAAGGSDATLAPALRAFCDGDRDAAVALAAAAAEHARAGADAALLVDAETVMALAATETEDAVSRARRASRMARSEGLLQQEYLANVILARVRRTSQRAYLSVRILTSLAQVVPEVWQPLVGLELAFAGGEPTRRGVAPLALVVEAATSGDRERLGREVLAARSLVSGCVPIAEELEDWIAMLDVDARLSDRVRPWASGRTDESPHGIRDARHGETRASWVVAAPGRTPRRVLGTGLGSLPGVETIRSGRRGTRTEESISLLALARQGLDPEAFFARVYGFAYEKAEHAEVLRGLIHRMRGTLGDTAELERGDGLLRIVPARALAVEDPRCQEPLADRVLDRLASSNGRATAKELTAALRVPLRTVQRALGQLVEDGACHAEPDGRKTEYVVEDTTFNEPSLHRLRGQRD
jgi:hypothetical protein